MGGTALGIIPGMAGGIAVTGGPKPLEDEVIYFFLEKRNRQQLVNDDVTECIIKKSFFVFTKYARLIIPTIFLPLRSRHCTLLLCKFIKYKNEICHHLDILHFFIPSFTVETHTLIIASMQQVYKLTLI